MTDQFLEAQMTIAFNYPLQALCFVLGGLLILIGLTMAIIIPAGKMHSRGMHLLGSGALIALPGALPIILKVISGSGTDLSNVPGWLMSAIYIATPLLGIGAGVYGWIEAGRKTSEVET